MAKGTAAAIDACDDVTVQGKWIDALWQMSFSLWVKVEMECFSHMLGGYSQHLQDSEGGDTHTHIDEEEILATSRISFFLS